MYSYRIRVSALALFALATQWGWAQTFQGGIRGTLADASGAVIVDAKVTVTDVATGISRSTLSSNGGEYTFAALNPATYRITVEAPGFKTLEKKDVVVGTQEYLIIDLKMAVGEVTQSVNVEGSAAPLLETENASTGQVIDTQKLADLPNMGRNPFYEGVKISQNVTPGGNPQFNRMEDQSGSSQISIAGGPVRGNNYPLDGISITDAANRAIIIPTLEAVQEVKVQANTYDAEMARPGGGMFNTYLKSGGNEFHGSLFGSMRQTSWAANNYFNNAAGLPLPEQPNRTFGASFGGPVRIPRVYNGKNRTFFWLAWEGYDDTQSNSSQFYT